MKVSDVPVPAHRLMLGDVGRTVISETYRDKNKTTKPTTWRKRDGTVGRKRLYTIDSIYVHSNGNILINSGIYLRRDTDVFFVLEMDDGDDADY
ncbi:hypothetical protein SEA_PAULODIABOLI_172 [Microbacterium phage PauloDiaboli]|nr:hypothetical protein SEA_PAULODIABOLI_172 [Microbacterium phage PauloDiaboli]QWY83985.1 hypothetical protein SEA_A3WALLY_172 [Microbacterium phage A3Wally]